MSLYSHKTLGGVLLVAGTAIGAGMLALPVTTGVGGFFPSVLFLVVGFAYMLLSLFLLLEATLYSQHIDTNIITLTKSYAKLPGQIAAWLSFLLLLYAVAAAYLTAGGSLIGHLLQTIDITAATPKIGTIAFMIIFGGIAFFGTRGVDYLNRFLMLGLILAFLYLVAFVLPKIQAVHLTEAHPKLLLAAIPVIVLSFTSHIIVPSLRTYFQGDTKRLKKVLLIGSLLPLLFYIIWELVILGILPISGPHGLAVIGASIHPVAEMTKALHDNFGIVGIALAAGCFSFFALVTSFLGVTLSLSDFLADGLQISKTSFGRLRLLLMTLIPPLGFAFLYPSGFVMALGYAGVFVAILYGILPVFIVWRCRYKLNLTSEFTLFGGKPMLIVIAMGAIGIIVFQVASTLHLLPTF